MKIGILVTIISGFGKKGFYHSQEVGLGKALRDLGHEVIVYKCIPKGTETEEILIDDHMRVVYPHVRSLGVHGYVQTEVIDPSLDGLLVFADTQIFLPHVYKYCRKNGICFVPYVGIAHSFQRNLKSRVMDLLYAMGTRRIYRHIPILVKTEAVREELASQGIRDCTVTPVGLDETELKTDFRLYDRREIRAKYGYSEQDVIISFVARLQAEKRPLDLLDIFEHVQKRKPCKLLIIGTGYQQEEVQSKIRAKGLEREVQLIERVPYDNMWEIHYLSDYFLNLRVDEIFGMALMEAVYYESSVVAHRAPGPDCILENLPGHVLCSNDTEMETWLLQEKPEAMVLESSSRELIHKFSWNHCAREFCRLTEEFQVNGKGKRKVSQS